MEKTFPLNAALCSHPSLFKRSPPGHEILCVGFYCGGFPRRTGFSPPNLRLGLVAWFLLWRVIGCWESRGREAGIRPQERLRAAWRERRREWVRRRESALGQGEEARGLGLLLSARLRSVCSQIPFPFLPGLGAQAALPRFSSEQASLSLLGWRAACPKRAFCSRLAAVRAVGVTASPGLGVLNTRRPEGSCPEPRGEAPGPLEPPLTRGSGDDGGRRIGARPLSPGGLW